jgi:RNA polymerase sigma-B factor
VTATSTRIDTAPATAPSTALDETMTSATAADSASDLLNAMAAMPTGHPSRAALRDRAIEAWLPLAKHLAHRYAGRGEPTDDLVQTANIGLIKAVDRFDPDRGIDFAGYAIPTIVGEIKRHFRDRTWSIRVPRRLQELRLLITEANATLSHTLGRPPLVADIAVHLGITEEEVLEGLEGARAYRTTSLSMPVGADGSLQVGDSFGADDHEYELAELRIVLAPALARLNERERRIVTLRFYGNQTQAQIAAQMGVSQMHISRLLTAALTKLRTHMGPDTY